MTSEPASHFAQVLRVLDGERVPFDCLTSKTLRFMLEGPQGCDVLLEPGRFEVRFGRNRARNRYTPDTGTAVVSYLLGAMRAVEGASDFQGLIGPAAVPALDWLPWSYGRRRVWIRRSDSSVTIKIRCDETASDSPAPFPEPIEFPPPVFVDVPETLSCPTCGGASSRFRQLPGGFLVCHSCGGSFAPDKRVVAQPAVAADGAARRP
jgi:hypothetical protein